MPMQSDVAIDLRVNEWIEATDLEIVKQRETIAILETEGHEVTDAKRHLGEMLVSLACMLRSKKEPGANQ